MIGLILKLAACTYGPLLGLFGFGILTTRTVRGAWVPWVRLATVEFMRIMPVTPVEYA